MPPSDEPSAASALSGHLDTRTAATEVAHLLHDGIGEQPDLVLTFASYHHRAALPEAMATIRQTLRPQTSLAVTCESVLGDDDELEGVAGFASIAMRLPHARVEAWHSTPEDPIRTSDPAAVAERIHFADDHRATLMLGEPFSTPITKLLPALNGCGGNSSAPIIGAMASGASQPGNNLLILDDQEVQQGVIGATISGHIAVDAIVSQGCRPIGEPYVITQSSDHVIQQLGGQPAMAAMKHLTETISDRDRDLVRKGMLIGTVIDETRRPFGRGNFLVRNIVGLDQKKGAILVGDQPRMGQTIQFHVRDAVTAEEDLQLLLDGEELKNPPFAALLFTCNSRGKQLFGSPNHDLAIIRERFGPIPIAGFFAAGEIGPIGDTSFLHGHTAVLCLLRAR